MNPLFYPSKSKACESKSGLEKHRKIIKYNDTQSNKAIKDNIPDSWYYNDKKANNIWESLEVDPAVKFEPTDETKSPFAQIDQSAQRIRQMIMSYEISDQELLVNLMDILEQEDEFFGNYHDDDALFEAKLRLGSMINDHSGNTDAQEKMLDSLRSWFDSLTKKSEAEGDGEVKNLKDTYNVDVTQLAEMINSSFETREMNSEQLQLLHRSVVDNLTRQIRDMRRKITEQEETIDELNKTIEVQKSNRKRQLKNLQKDEKDIMNYQRTICEKDAKIIDLKSTITEIAVESKTARQPQQQQQQQQPYEEEDPEKQEELIASSLEKDFELDTRIRSMAETISSLKEELNETILQLRKETQNGFTLENKLQLLDRTKKSIEQTLSSTNERYALLEKKLKDKSDEYEKLQKSQENSAVIEAINETKREYEEKIQTILETNRTNVSKAVENVEKRYKKQMAELMKAVDAGETQAAINELNNQHLNEIAIIKKECQEEIENLRISNGNRLSLLTKHYETKISQMLTDHKRLQESSEKDLEMHVEEKRIEIEEDFSRKIIDIQDKAATDLTDLKARFEAKMVRLEGKLHRIESERDTLTGIIEDNDLLDEIPDDFNETTVEDNGDEDDVLADSILQLKKREIEKDVSEKYAILLKSQRQCIEQAKNWEIEKLKDTFQTNLNEKFSDLRRGIMENLIQLKSSLLSSDKPAKETDDVDKTIISTLKLVESNDSKVFDTIDRQFIPLNEVESRLSECNEKINDLSGENEFLRFTLQQLNNGKDLVNDNNEDLIRAMRSSIANQANQISQTLKEYDDMKARIEYYEQKEHVAETSDQLVQTDEIQKPICKKQSFVIFSRNEINITKANVIKEEELILRDNLNSGRAKRQRTLNKSSSRKNTNEVESNNEGFNADIVLFDVFTQTDEISYPKPKKKVKKVKNNENTESQNTNVDRSIDTTNNDSQQQNEENSKDENANNDNLANEEKTTQKQNQSQNIKSSRKESVINNDEIEEEDQKEDNEESKNVKKEQNNTGLNSQREKLTDRKPNEKVEDAENEYEYEYDDNYPQIIKLTKLSFIRQNCIFEINPDGERQDSYIAECPSCHQNVSFDPKISEISTTVDPVIECPHCHSSVTIDKEKYPVMFQDDYCNVQNSLSLTPEEHSQIAAMEGKIQKQITDLIQMKQKLIKEQSNDNDSGSHFRDDLEPSLPTAILSLPKTEEQNEKTNKYNSEVSVVLKVSSNSLAIEIPASSVEFQSQPVSSSSSRRISSRLDSASTLSSRSFISKFDQENGQINSAEQQIDKEISKLIEFKQELLSKKSSTKNSNMNSAKNSNLNSTRNSNLNSTKNSNLNSAKNSNLNSTKNSNLNSAKNSNLNSNLNSNMNSDNEDENSSSNPSRKLKLEEMPQSGSNGSNGAAIGNIASDLQMNDVQLQRSAKTAEKENETQNADKKAATFVQSQHSHGLVVQASSDYFSPLKKSNLTIGGAAIFNKGQVPPTVDDYLKSLAIQTVSEIDVSIENDSIAPIKKLETIEKAVLTLSTLNAFSSSNENQLLATNIIQKAQSLKDIDPSQIPSEEVEEVVQSARKLLVSLCHENELEQVNIKPLSQEAGGFLSDDVEQLRDENLKYKNEIIFINEKQAKLKEEVQDLNDSTKELKLKHEEIIFSLQKIIGNIVKSIQNGEGKLDTNSLNTLKDQAKYLIGSMKEKENLEADNKETNELLKERDIEIISLNHAIQNKEGQIQDLSTKLSQLTAHVENINLHNQGQQFNVENLEKMNKENKKVIDQMSDALFKMKDNSEELQRKLDQLELDNQQLQNKMVMKESEVPIAYSFIKPFIIFDTVIESSLPSKGFTLIPGKNRYDQTASQKVSSNDENSTEKIRVKYNQTNQQQLVSGSPKLIVPKTSQARSRLTKNSASTSNKTSVNNNNDLGYIDFVPVHGEDPKSLIYIKKMRNNDNRGYYDRHPVNGNVVLQKTVTNLNRRIFSLQTILQAKAHEMIKLRDQKSEARQNLYKTAIQLQRVQKELVRSQTNSMLADEKLNKAYKIIEERDAEIRELRDLIRQLRTAAAQPALMHHVMSNIAEDQSNLAAMRAFRGQTTLNEMAKSYNVDSTLKRFAQRQMAVVKRWEKRRKDLIRQQQSHLLAVLAGMSLIASPDKNKKLNTKNENPDDQINEEIVKKYSSRKAITVTPMATKNKSKKHPKKESTPNIISTNQNAEFDSSWKNANSSHPRIPDGMKDGVIAQPL